MQCVNVSYVPCFVMTFSFRNGMQHPIIITTFLHYILHYYNLLTLVTPLSQHSLRYVYAWGYASPKHCHGPILYLDCIYRTIASNQPSVYQS